MVKDLTRPARRGFAPATPLAIPRFSIPETLKKPCDERSLMAISLAEVGILNEGHLCATDPVNKALADLLGDSAMDIQVAWTEDFDNHHNYHLLSNEHREWHPNVESSYGKGQLGGLFVCTPSPDPLELMTKLMPVYVASPETAQCLIAALESCAAFLHIPVVTPAWTLEEAKRQWWQGEDNETFSLQEFNDEKAAGHHGADAEYEGKTRAQYDAVVPTWVTNPSVGTLPDMLATLESSPLPEAALALKAVAACRALDGCNDIRFVEQRSEFTSPWLIHWSKSDFTQEVVDEGYNLEMQCGEALPDINFVALFKFRKSIQLKNAADRLKSFITALNALNEFICSIGCKL